MNRPFVKRFQRSQDAPSSMRMLPTETSLVSRSMVIHGATNAVCTPDGRCGSCNTLTNSRTEQCQGCGATLAMRGASAPNLRTLVLSRKRGELNTARSLTDSLASNASSITVEQVVAIETFVGHDLPWSEDNTCVVLTATDIGNIHDKETLEFLSAMSPYLVKYYSTLSQTPSAQPTQDTFITAVDDIGTEHTISVAGDRQLTVPVLHVPTLCDSPIPDDAGSDITFGLDGGSDACRMEVMSPDCDDLEETSTNLSAFEQESDDTSMYIGSVVSGAQNKNLPPKAPVRRRIAIPKGDTSVPSYMRGTKANSDKRKINVHSSDLAPPEGMADAVIPSAPGGPRSVVSSTAPTNVVNPRFYELTEEDEVRVQAILDDEERFGGGGEGDDVTVMVVKEGEGYGMTKSDAEKMAELDEKLAKLRPQGGGASSHRSTPRSAAKKVAPSVKETKSSAKENKKPDLIAEMREERSERRAMKDVNDRLTALHEKTELLHTPPFAFNRQYEMEAEPGTWTWPEGVPRVSDLALRKLLMDACAEQGVDPSTLMDPDEAEAEMAMKRRVLMMPADYADYDYA